MMHGSPFIGNLGIFGIHSPKMEVITPLITFTLSETKTKHELFLTQQDPNNSMKMTPHHVVPDEPVMYETQSRTRNFWRPKMLPYMAVSALMPHPVVVTATIGTCSTQKKSRSHR